MGSGTPAIHLRFHRVGIRVNRHRFAAVVISNLPSDGKSTVHLISRQVIRMRHFLPDIRSAREAGSHVHERQLHTRVGLSWFPGLSGRVQIEVWPQEADESLRDRRQDRRIR